ncbi:MAG: 50S ribosomal protein L18Ae [Candidatus Bathyarchaeota archaeon]|jgi:large subunit ribosomal protein LX
MAEVRAFKVFGKIHKPNLVTSFEKEVMAVQPEHAIEKVYTDLGSRHRVKRHHITIIEVKEITFGELTDLTLKKLVEGEDVDREGSR